MSLVTIEYKGVKITAESANETSGIGMAGMIARLIYMHDLDNNGQTGLQIGIELKRLLDNKYGAEKVTQPDPWKRT